MELFMPINLSGVTVVVVIYAEKTLLKLVAPDTTKNVKQDFCRLCCKDKNVKRKQKAPGVIARGFLASTVI
jgi:hypothetical protein